MDPISITTSLVALMSLTKNVAQYLKEIKSGSDDRVRLREEIRSTMCLIEMLQDRVDDADSLSKDLASIRSLEFPGGPLELLGNALRQLIEKLASNGRLQRLSRTLLWPLSKEEVDDLISVIERQKAAFTLAIQNDNM